MLEIVLSENEKYRVRDFNIMYNYEPWDHKLVCNIQFCLRDNKELKDNMGPELITILQTDIPLYLNGQEYLHFRDYQFSDLNYFENETDENNTTLTLRKEEDLS